MRNLHPWKLLGPKTPVNKPGRDWFNAVSSVLSTIQIRYSSDLQPSIERPNADGTNWQIRIPNPAAATADGSYRWRVTYDNGDTQEIRVFQGSWTRLGTRVTLTVSGEGYEPITAEIFDPLSTYYVYAQLEGDTYDPALIPDSVAVYAATSLPADNAANTIRLLATLTTDAQGLFSSVVQNWRGGDMDDIAIMPDTESAYDTTGDTANYSLQYSPRTSSRHTGVLQDYNWHAASDDTPDANSLFVYRHVYEPETSDEAYIKKYCSIATLADSLTPELADELNCDSEIVGQILPQYSIERRTIYDDGTPPTALGTGLQIWGMNDAAAGALSDGADFCLRTGPGENPNQVFWVDETTIETWVKNFISDAEWWETSFDHDLDWHNLDGDGIAPNKIIIGNADGVNFHWVSLGEFLQSGDGLTAGSFQAMRNGVTVDVTVTNGLITGIVDASE